MAPKRLCAFCDIGARYQSETRLLEYGCRGGLWRGYNLRWKFAWNGLGRHEKTAPFSLPRIGFHATSRGFRHAGSRGTAVDQRQNIRCRVAADNHDQPTGEHDDACIDAG